MESGPKLLQHRLPRSEYYIAVPAALFRILIAPVFKNPFTIFIHSSIYSEKSMLMKCWDRQTQSKHPMPATVVEPPHNHCLSTPQRVSVSSCLKSNLNRTSFQQQISMFQSHFQKVQKNTIDQNPNSVIEKKNSMSKKIWVSSVIPNTFCKRPYVLLSLRGKRPFSSGA